MQNIDIKNRDEKKVKLKWKAEERKMRNKKGFKEKQRRSK